MKHDLQDKIIGTIVILFIFVVLAITIGMGGMEGRIVKKQPKVEFESYYRACNSVCVENTIKDIRGGCFYGDNEGRVCGSFRIVQLERIKK